jgi:hypothetical protein
MGIGCESPLEACGNPLKDFEEFLGEPEQTESKVEVVEGMFGRLWDLWRRKIDFGDFFCFDFEFEV